LFIYLKKINCFAPNSLALLFFKKLMFLIINQVRCFCEPLALSRNLKYHNKKRHNDYEQNYYKIYHLAIVFNIASNKYWKDLLRLFII